MSTPSPDELLPVLVADLADEEARDVLEAAAFTGGRIWVPLETAPVSASPHVLEVHTPGGEPFLYLAEPLGAPTADGFPLRIRAMPDASSAAADRTAQPPAQPEILRGRRSQTALRLTDSHARDLSHAGAPRADETDPRIGRALANGKLVIEQLIGRGGVGAVYKARHRELMMPVAV
jgi:serine/threonine-protein kinase